MKVNQNLPGLLLDASCRDDGLAPGSAAGQPNLVIECLGEFAAAGVPAACQLCIADCVALPAPGHDEYRSWSWTLPTAR
jgi:hypothetical protein